MNLAECMDLLNTVARSAKMRERLYCSCDSNRISITSQRHDKALVIEKSWRHLIWSIQCYIVLF